MNNEQRISRMKEILTAEFSPRLLDIEDESHLHAGHEGAKSGKGHFKLTIVADAFANRKPIERHRMVFSALGDMMNTDIHALSIKASTTDE